MYTYYTHIHTYIYIYIHIYLKHHNMIQKKNMVQHNIVWYHLAYSMVSLVIWWFNIYVSLNMCIYFFTAMVPWGIWISIGCRSIVSKLLIIPYVWDKWLKHHPTISSIMGKVHYPSVNCDSLVQRWETCIVGDSEKWWVRRATFSWSNIWQPQKNHAWNPTKCVEN